MVFELFFNHTTVQPRNIKLKLKGLTVRLYQQFWKEMNCQLFLNIILYFAYLMCPSVSRPKALKNVSVICYVQFQWKVAEHFPNRIKKYGVFIKKSLSLKKYFERIKSQTPFCYLCVNLPSVKIWGQLDKFPMSFSFLQCPLQVKKLIREKQR